MAELKPIWRRRWLTSGCNAIFRSSLAPPSNWLTYSYGLNGIMTLNPNSNGSIDSPLLFSMTSVMCSKVEKRWKSCSPF
jgi:hypothetical protein